LVKKGSAGITASTTRNGPASRVVRFPVDIDIDIDIDISATRAGRDCTCGSNAVLLAQEIVGSADAANTKNAASMTDLIFMADFP
jgi:hypothetical protein